LKEVKERRRRRHLTGLIAAVALGGALLALPSFASAATVNCGGEVTAGDGPKDYLYSFGCTEFQGVVDHPAVVRGYSLLSTKQLAGFTPDVIVYDGAHAPVNDEAFQCEGPFPGYGFGCGGTMLPGTTAADKHTVEGGFELAKKACNKKGRKSKFQVWMTASVDRYNEVKDTTAVVSTEPFRVKTPKCDPLTK